MALPTLTRSLGVSLAPVSLRALLPDAEFVGCRDLHVSGCSRDGEPGRLRVDATGPDALLLEVARPDADVRQVVVRDGRSARARIAHAVVGSPSRDLSTIGVCGISGKAAATQFLRAILECHGSRVGTIGSPGWSDGPHHYPAGPEAPDATALAAMLAEMTESRCDHAVIAASSDSLAARHADGIAFRGAIVTGVSRDGEADADARRAMARMARSVVEGGILALRGDDPGAAVLAAANLSARVVTFGLGGEADVTAEVGDRDLGGTSFRLGLRGGEVSVRIRPMGDDAVIGAIGAAAMAEAMGIDPAAIVAGLESVAPLPGRLEVIAEGSGRVVVLATAADAGSLRSALRAVRERSLGRVVCLLSATSEVAAAPFLVRAAEQESDRVVLTHEPLAGTPAHAEAWLTRFDRPGRVRVLLDRSKALTAALDLSAPGDILVLTGPAPGPSCRDREVADRWMRRQGVLSTRRTA